VIQITTAGNACRFRLLVLAAAEYNV